MMESAKDVKLTRHSAVYWTHDALQHAVQNCEAYGFHGDEAERRFVATQPIPSARNRHSVGITYIHRRAPNSGRITPVIDP